MPLNKKTQVGNTEREIAFHKSFLFQHTAQKIKYAAQSAAFTHRYTLNAHSNQNPKEVYGILKIMKKKQPYLPICSNISTDLF